MQLSVHFIQAGQADGIISTVCLSEYRKATFDFQNPTTLYAILGVENQSTIASYEDLKREGQSVLKTELLLKPLTENQSKYSLHKNQTPSLMVLQCT